VNERGSASVAAMAVVVLALSVGVALVDVTGLMSSRVAAEAAADAAALAAAPLTFLGSPDPAREAARLAEANGARLRTCRCPIDRSLATRIVEVEVEMVVTTMAIGRHLIVVRSRAEFDPGAALTPPP
jgi:secretion/DNA translocation related TadE-like protein